MAQSPGRISEKAQNSLVGYVKYALEENRRRSDFYNKMCYIDAAYARYKQEEDANTAEPGVDAALSEAGTVGCGTLRDITAPIVISQVDSFVAYLADVYCSGYPMFPVVSSPKTKDAAITLQSITDTHALLGGYQRQFVKFFKDCMKYNVGALEVDWAPIERYSLLSDIMKPLDPSQVKKQTEFYNRITQRSTYNLIWDRRVEEMADVPLKGEFVGYVELLSRVELTRELQYLNTTEWGYNASKALHTGLGQNAGVGATSFAGMYYRERPQISEILSGRNIRDLADFDWLGWMMNVPNKPERRSPRGMYEIATLYARIIPEDHGIYNQNSSVPQIWKLKVVNNTKLICAQRIISVYDLLPIFIGQPFEDGFAEQTQSLAEMQIPYQRTVSKLINIRIHAARRAVADRGIYDPTMIDETDMNSPHPAAKIPIKPNSKLAGKGLEDAYKATPFMAQGLETVIQDAALIEGMAGKSSGLNKPQQGEFQRGNKSVKEWNDTMAGSDNRLRVPALVLEYQVVAPIKDQLKLNIYQYGPTGIFQDVKKGESVEVTQEKINELRKTVLYFKMADGYIPVSKMASTEAIANGMAMIGNSPVLQQAMGYKLPSMFAHLMQLQGVQGLEEYVPTEAETKANMVNPALNPNAAQQTPSA